MSFLTEDQISFFSVFGYLGFPGLLADEIDDIQDSFDSVFERYSADVVNWVHETHDNRPRRFISSFVEKDERLHSLLKDPRIVGILRSLIGEEYHYRCSDGSVFDCGTQYHIDGYMADLSKLNIKLGIYLDNVDEESGALRVIPGSHFSRDDYASRVRKNVIERSTAFGRPIDEIPSKVLVSKPGDVFLWNYRLIHASCYRGNARRLLAMEFSEPYDSPKG